MWRAKVDGPLTYSLVIVGGSPGLSHFPRIHFYPVSDSGRNFKLGTLSTTSSVQLESASPLTRYVVASGAAEITDPTKVALRLSAVSRNNSMTDVVWAIVPSVRAAASKNDLDSIMGAKLLVVCQVQDWLVII